MMQADNKIMDDLAKLAGGAAGLMTDIKREIEQRIRAQAEAVLARLDLVRREEFEAARDVAIAAREETQKLEARVAALEESLRKKLEINP